MIKEELKNACRFLMKVFDGDHVAIATIVTAEAENDYDTIKRILLELQSAIGRAYIALSKADDRPKCKDCKYYCHCLYTCMHPENEGRRVCDNDTACEKIDKKEDDKCPKHLKRS
jgi:hypothetical protein